MLQGCVERRDPWVGKNMLFLRATEGLLKTQEALPEHTAEDKRRMQEVSDILYRALFWRRWLYEEDFRSHPVPEFAREAYQLVCDVSESHGAPSSPRDLARVRRAVHTLNAAIVGQRPDAKDVADAANLCRECGEYLTALRSHRSRTDDDE